MLKRGAVLRFLCKVLSVSSSQCCSYKGLFLHIREADLPVLKGLAQSLVFLAQAARDRAELQESADDSCWPCAANAWHHMPSNALLPT